MIRHPSLARRYHLEGVPPGGNRWRIVDSRDGHQVASITRGHGGGGNLDPHAWGLWNRYGEPIGTVSTSFRLDQVARLAAYRVQMEPGTLEDLEDHRVEPPAGWTGDNGA